MLFTLQMKRNFKGKSQILRDFLPLKWKLQFTVRITYFLIQKNGLKYKKGQSCTVKSVLLILKITLIFRVKSLIFTYRKKHA